MSEPTTNRRSILAAGLAALSWLFGRSGEGKPPVDDGAWLGQDERKEKLRNWFKKHTESCAPTSLLLVVGGHACDGEASRALGELVFENGSSKQMFVGFDPHETQDEAREFLAEFKKNAATFCPSVPLVFNPQTQSLPAQP